MRCASASAPNSAMRSAAAPRRARVVPQQRGADDPPLGVERDHAVLLPADRPRRDVVRGLPASGDRAPAAPSTTPRGRPRCRRGARHAPDRTTAPVAASVTTTLQDCVDESTPMTSVIAPAPSFSGVLQVPNYCGLDARCDDRRLGSTGDECSRSEAAEAVEGQRAPSRCSVASCCRRTKPKPLPPRYASVSKSS